MYTSSLYVTTYALIFSSSSAKRASESFKIVSEHPSVFVSNSANNPTVFIVCQLKESLASTLPAIWYTAEFIW